MTMLLLVESSQLRAVRGRGAVTVLPLRRGRSDDGDAAVWADSVRSAVREGIPAAERAGDVVLVLGLALTEVAMPALPPLAAAVQRRVIERDADRYFPMDGEVAVALRDGIAFGIAGNILHELVQAASDAGRVRAVVTLAELLARHGGSRSYAVDAGPGEHGVIRVEAGVLREARRTAAGDAADQAGAVAVSDALLQAMAPTATRIAGERTDSMLLDRRTRAAIEGARRGRWYRSLAGLAAALLALGVALDARQARSLEAATRRFDASRLQNASAVATRDRLLRVSRESALIAAGAGRPSLAETLDRLGRVLPADAFVERMEWRDGQWRIDGSAANAARLVPLLDAEPSLADVRVLAASSRFVDGGRQRESFSIGFTVREPRASGGGSADAATALAPAGGARGGS